MGKNFFTEEFCRMHAILPLHKETPSNPRIYACTKCHTPNLLTPDDLEEDFTCDECTAELLCPNCAELVTEPHTLCPECQTQSNSENYG